MEQTREQLWLRWPLAAMALLALGASVPQMPHYAADQTFDDDPEGITQCERNYSLRSLVRRSPPPDPQCVYWPGVVGDVPRCVAVTGAGMSAANGKYVEQGQCNGRSALANENGIWLHWTPRNAWRIATHVGGPAYYVAAEVGGPWRAVSGDAPAPTACVSDSCP